MIRLLTLIIFLIGGVFLFSGIGVIDVSDIFDTDTAEESEVLVIERIEIDKKEILKEVKDDIKPIVPAVPIVTTAIEPLSVLSNFGVFAWTNTQRILNRLTPLKSSKLLDKVAEIKLDDMFARQYFAHSAPTGEGVGDLAGTVGYEYILIGENLAFGDFDDDKTLLDAWMDSPGHRANTLNPQYDEIGIAVGRGDFDGRTTWLAVQSFGLPLSVCDEIDKKLLKDINDRKELLDTLESELNDLQAEIEATHPKRGTYYSSLVDSYNSLVNQYNALRVELNEWVNKYNLQVNEFNACASAS